MVRAKFYAQCFLYIFGSFKSHYILKGISCYFLNFKDKVNLREVE